MNGFAGLSIDKSELAIGLAIVAILGTLALWKKRFATKAEAWPTIAAKIENVFLDVSRGGPNRSDVTHTVLAYSYSINDTTQARLGFRRAKSISSRLRRR